MSESRPTLPYPILPVVKTNKQTNKHGRLYFGFYLSTGEADLQLVEAIERLRRRDGWTRTTLFKTALLEYVARHDPGNPGLPLEHWTKNEPFSEAAKEKLAVPPPQPKPSPNYAEMTTERLLEMYRHPWRLQGFDRQLVGHLLKQRGVDLQKATKGDLK